MNPRIAHGTSTQASHRISTAGSVESCGWRQGGRIGRGNWITVMQPPSCAARAACAPCRAPASRRRLWRASMHPKRPAYLQLCPHCGEREGEGEGEGERDEGLHGRGSLCGSRLFSHHLWFCVKPQTTPYEEMLSRAPRGCRNPHDNRALVALISRDIQRTIVLDAIIPCTKSSRGGRLWGRRFSRLSPEFSAAVSIWSWFRTRRPDRPRNAQPMSGFRSSLPTTLIRVLPPTSAWDGGGSRAIGLRRGSSCRATP